MVAEVIPNITIVYADNIRTEDIVSFFNIHLDTSSDSIPREFFCPLGLRAAINRKQVIIGLDTSSCIISAVRFYPRKKDGVISIYQHAINTNYDKDEVLKQMLNFIDGDVFEFL